MTDAKCTCPLLPGGYLIHTKGCPWMLSQSIDAWRVPTPRSDWFEFRGNITTLANGTRIRLIDVPGWFEFKDKRALIVDNSLLQTTSLAAAVGYTLKFQLLEATPSFATGTVMHLTGVRFYLDP